MKTTKKTRLTVKALELKAQEMFRLVALKTPGMNKYFAAGYGYNRAAGRLADGDSDGAKASALLASEFATLAAQMDAGN